jgi:hypothetical protein
MTCPRLGALAELEPASATPVKARTTTPFLDDQAVNVFALFLKRGRDRVDVLLHVLIREGLGMAKRPADRSQTAPQGPDRHNSKPGSILFRHQRLSV